MSSPQTRALAHVAMRSRGEPLAAEHHVTLSFHPDRSHDGVPLLERFFVDGVYRSQFETKTSNGALTAVEGGSRWQWESRIFGGAYDDGPASERPKYGALNIGNRLVGASPRFGSAYLRLARQTLARTTFCYPDSVFEPEHFGVVDRMGLLAVAASTKPDDPLDDYVEAHVHGPIVLSRDVEAIVLDPCYKGSFVEALARKLPCKVAWHGGFRVHVDTLRDKADYRGPRYVELGVSLARDGYLTPAVVGDAARSGQFDPQDLKKVWHYLARFGELTLA